MSDWVERYHQQKRAEQDTKGGPGSGHHGHAGRPGKRGGSLPGKGGGGQVGAKGQPKHIGRISKELYDRWYKQVVDEWDDTRGGMATNALYNCHAQWSDMEAMAIEEGGELKAIIAVNVPKGRYNPLMGETEPVRPDAQVTADYLASKERGYGTRMLRSVIELAGKQNLGFVFSATKEAKPFYLKLGLRPVAEGETLFSLTNKDVKRWLKTGKM